MFCSNFIAYFHHLILFKHRNHTEKYGENASKRSLFVEENEGKKSHILNCLHDAHLLQQQKKRATGLRVFEL